MTFKMFAKGLLLVCCAPIVMIGIVLAIIPTFIVKMVQLIINRDKTVKEVVPEMEEAPRLMSESSNLAHVVGWR